MDRKVFFIVVLALCLLVCRLPMLIGAEEKRARPLSRRTEPIKIVSDRLDAFSENRLVVFSGNAVATQGNKTIKSDRLFLYYKKNARDAKIVASKTFGGTGDLERIEAKGHVVITDGERSVTGNEATFYQDTQKIVMTGNAVMREGDNVIQGEKILVFLDENRGIVESTAGKRVTATIYPKEAEEKKK